MIHLSLVDKGEYSTGRPILNCDGGSKSTRGYMNRTNASVPTPIELSTAPHPRNPSKSRRVGAIRQMWTSGLVPSSLLPAPATAYLCAPFRAAFTKADAAASTWASTSRPATLRQILRSVTTRVRAVAGRIFAAMAI